MSFPMTLGRDRLGGCRGRPVAIVVSANCTWHTSDATCDKPSPSCQKAIIRGTFRQKPSNPTLLIPQRTSTTPCLLCFLLWDWLYTSQFPASENSHFLEPKLNISWTVEYVVGVASVKLFAQLGKAFVCESTIFATPRAIGLILRGYKKKPNAPYA